MQAKKRCFIAINLPPDIKDELARVINELRKIYKYLPPHQRFWCGGIKKEHRAPWSKTADRRHLWRGGLPIKWTEADNLHITLYFLGSIDDEMIGRVGECLENLTKKYRPTKLKLGGIGAFPNLENPRVIYVQGKELEGAILESLVNALGKDLEYLGIDINHRPWHPHITLGRVKAGGVKLKTNGIKVAPLEFRVKSLELMASELNADGPVYSIIKSYYF